jgi:hypothetical protein
MSHVDIKTSIARTVGQLHLCLVALIAFFGVLWGVSDGNNEVFLNETMPIGTLLTLCYFAIRMVKAHPVLIWSPLPWFMIACAAYCGIGPLAYHYGNEATIASCDGYYMISESELVRSNFLNLIGIASVMAGVYLGVRVFVKNRAVPSTRWSAPDLAHLGRLAVFFLVVGVLVKYALVLPYEFGMLGFVLPGSVGTLQYFTLFAMAVLMLLVHQGDAKWRPVLCILVASEFVTAILVFSKMSVMIFFVVLLLGRVLIAKRLRPILVGSLLIAITFAAVAPLVSHGRASLIESTGTHYKAGLGTRFDIVRAYLTSGGDTGDYAPSQLGWARLNYANAQAFAMNSFDAGVPGGSFSLVFYALVPRFLWPDKPIMTMGREFNYLVNGNLESSSAPGLFGEGYWNGGWLAVVLSSLFVGFVLASFTEYSMWAIANRNLLYLPIVFAGIKMGFRPDDWFVATYVGATVTAVCMHFVLRCLSVFLGAPVGWSDESEPRGMVTT